MSANPHRRTILLEPLRLAGLAGAAALAPAAWAQSKAAPASSGLLSVQEMLDSVTNGASARPQGVALHVAPLADNGHLVPLRVVVDSPMTPADHVRSITLLSQRNPVTRMAQFQLGPWSGRAEVATRVRLAGTQVVVALAQLSSGEFRWAQAEVVVTESACLDMG